VRFVTCLERHDRIRGHRDGGRDFGQRTPIGTLESERVVRGARDAEIPQGDPPFAQWRT